MRHTLWRLALRENMRALGVARQIMLAQPWQPYMVKKRSALAQTKAAGIIAMLRNANRGAWRSKLEAARHRRTRVCAARHGCNQCKASHRAAAGVASRQRDINARNEIPGNVAISVAQCYRALIIKAASAGAQQYVGISARK